MDIIMIIILSIIMIGVFSLFITVIISLRDDIGDNVVYTIMGFSIILIVLFTIAVCIELLG